MRSSLLRMRSNSFSRFLEKNGGMPDEQPNPTQR
jgi:hypothetical protein